MLTKAVLFAAAEPSTRHDTVPALMPVGNKPLVLHALEDVIDAGVREVAVVSSPSVAEEVAAIVAEAAGDRIMLTSIVREGPAFTDALRQAAPVIEDEPFIVHLGDNLCHGDLTDAIGEVRVRGNDVVALVEPDGHDVTPLGAGLASLRSAGIYVFGPGVMQLSPEEDSPDDWDLQIAAAADRLAAGGGHLALRAVREWWRYRDRPDALLQANRFFLSGIRSGPREAWLENTDLQGPVIVHPSARLISSTVRGPAIVGPGAEIRDAYIGPYSAIGAGVVIENAEVEHSIILDGASIRNLGGRLEASVVGPRARVFRDFRLPRAFRLNVGERAEVALT
jgi:glucose-1-phosphate thymidylyltransferase